MRQKVQCTEDPHTCCLQLKGIIGLITFRREKKCLSPGTVLGNYTVYSDTNSSALMNKYIDLYTHSLKVKWPVARVSIPRQAKPLKPKAGILTEGHFRPEKVKFAPNGG